MRPGFACLTICALLLGACAAPLPVAEKSPDLPPGPVLTFAPVAPPPPARPNAQMAQDYLDLVFALESGQPLAQLTRFETPITLAVTGAVPPSAPGEIASLRRRLAREAGITLQATTGPASITLVFVPKAELTRLEPLAACFVAPNVTSVADYRSRRGTRAVDWSSLTDRARVAIFLPADSTPQDLRDCLHEETAQALGPLNDLYRLPDSVFNDDNFQSVLTGFDMLMLRLHYAPELASGMTRADVAARLPALFARLNPGGGGGAGWDNPETPQAWSAAIARALDPRGGPQRRLTAALQAMSLAEAQGWGDNRMGFTLFTLGRLLVPVDPVAAKRSFLLAAQIYADLPGGGLHLAHVQMQLAAFAISEGRPDLVPGLVDQALPVATAAQNAALMANLMLVKSYALAALGRDIEAAALRLDSLPAARYGFGREQGMTMPRLQN